MVMLFKAECLQPAAKRRDLLAEGGATIEGPFDGEEAKTLLPDLQAVTKGSMTSALISD